MITQLKETHVSILKKITSDPSTLFLAKHSVGTVYCPLRHWRWQLGALTWHAMCADVEELCEAKIMFKIPPENENDPHLVALNGAGLDLAFAVTQPNKPEYFAVVDDKLVYGDKETVEEATQTKWCAMLAGIDPTAKGTATQKPADAEKSTADGLTVQSAKQSDNKHKSDLDRKQAKVAAEKTARQIAEKLITRNQAKDPAKAGSLLDKLVAAEAETRSTKKKTKPRQVPATAAAFASVVRAYVQRLKVGSRTNASLIRAAVERQGHKPAHYNAWGSAIRYCVMHGLLAWNGKYVLSSIPSARSRRTQEYTRCKPKN